jgi:predicted amidohydrolase
VNLDRPIVAAAAQIAPVFMKKKESIEKYAEAILEAGKRRVDVLVTPETGIPSYPYWRNNFGYTTTESAALWKDTVVAFYDQAVRIPSRETEILSKAAASARVVVVGINEQDDREGSATLYNTMLFIDRDGTLLGRHRKLMPTHQERFFWGRGEASDLRTFDTHFGKLGGLICFENHMTLLKAAMAANKVPGVRAALCVDVKAATNAREHNDANVMTLGAGFVSASAVPEIVKTFLEVRCTEERHLKRVSKIRAIEERYAK